jgi:hypothetical protein
MCPYELTAPTNRRLQKTLLLRVCVGGTKYYLSRFAAGLAGSLPLILRRAWMIVGAVEQVWY